MEEVIFAAEAEARREVKPDQAVGPRDVREFIAAIEKIGQLKRISAEVSRNEEMGAVTYMYNHRVGAPALLFEKIKGCPPGFRALWNQLGSSNDRFALAIGESTGLSANELIRRFKERSDRRIAPVMVDPKDAPVNAHHMRGNDIDVTRFPAARHWALDGGEYIGTCDATITRDPEGGWLNVGCYRQMLQSKNEVGLFLAGGRDARLHIERNWAMGKPCEVVACWGIDPVLFMTASQSFPLSELDYAGGLAGRPIELVPGEATSLPYPARAEIVMEGVIPPGSERAEGPFGEFTGYYAKPPGPAFLMQVKAVHYRDNPILTHALMADYYPANECALVRSLGRSARIWSDLERLGIPGIKGIYCHPAAAGGLAMTIISIEQRYAGHAKQVLALAAQCPAGAYFSKWIIAVDEDVDPTDINQVLWAMATRCHPATGIDFMRDTYSTFLDPSQNPVENRQFGSKALINACKDYRFIKEFSPRTKVRRSTYEAVRRRWKELGLEGQPPQLRALEED